MQTDLPTDLTKFGTKVFAKPLIENEHKLAKVIPGIEHLGRALQIEAPTGHVLRAANHHLFGGSMISGGSLINKTGIVSNQDEMSATNEVIHGTMMKPSSHQTYQELGFSSSVYAGSQFAPNETPSIVHGSFAPYPFIKTGGIPEYHIISNGLNDYGPGPTFRMQNDFQGFYPSFN